MDCLRIELLSTITACLTDLMCLLAYISIPPCQKTSGRHAVSDNGRAWAFLTYSPSIPVSGAKSVSNPRQTRTTRQWTCRWRPQSSVRTLSLPQPPRTHRTPPATTIGRGQDGDTRGLPVLQDVQEEALVIVSRELQAVHWREFDRTRCSARLQKHGDPVSVRAGHVHRWTHWHDTQPPIVSWRPRGGRG